MRLATIKLETARALRDNPHLRTLDKRKDIIDIVQSRQPRADASTIKRSCRYIQNTLGKYRSDEQDELLRGEMESEYKQYFGSRWEE